MFTHMHIYAFMFLQVFGESGKRDPYSCLANHGCHTILLTMFDEYLTIPIKSAAPTADRCQCKIL